MKPQKVQFASGSSFAVGNLYLPIGYQPGTRYPAAVIGGSLTSVKEQMSGTYAQAMAERGFVALAIDYRHYGESGGEPRQLENPAHKAEDLSSALTYLAARADVRADGVSAIGVCTSGGNVMYAAANDSRFASVASVAGHLVEPSIIQSFPPYGGAERIAQHRADGRAARERYERTGENTLITAYHDSDLTASHTGPLVYYFDTKRGGGVREWKNQFSALSWADWLAFDPISQAARVTTPAIIVHSNDCAMPDQARKAFGLLKGPKELHWTTGGHFDFYDNPAKIAETADAIATFFRAQLVARSDARTTRIDVARRFFSLLHDKNVDEWANLWTDDGRILVFYPPTGFASSIDGADQIVSGFRALFANFETFDPTITAVYPAADSDSVIVEYTVRATLANRAVYTNSNIAVFDFAGDKVRAYHDYLDPRRFQVVVDALPRS